jgi:hypothetical protein
MHSMTVAAPGEDELRLCDDVKSRNKLRMELNETQNEEASTLPSRNATMPPNQVPREATWCSVMNDLTLHDDLTISPTQELTIRGLVERSGTTRSENHAKETKHTNESRRPGSTISCRLPTVHVSSHERRRRKAGSREGRSGTWRLISDGR